MTDEILVRWESDDGWREGVVCCVGTCEPMLWTAVKDNMMAWIRNDNWKSESAAVIWDRHRSERVIVPLGKVRLVEPRCATCDGEDFPGHRS